MEFNNNNFESYLPDEITESTIVLDIPELANNLLLNDLIKIKENTICFASTSLYKDTIYIIILNIFGDKKIKVRYYAIPSFNLYNYKILFELRIHPYKNYVSFSSSFCQNVVCSSDNDDHYSALMIFSYPNATDYSLDIEQFLLDNNDISINDLKIDLKNYIIIENNIFGYIYDNILIKNMSQCENIKLYSSVNPTEEIKVNKAFGKDEQIILNLIKSNNDYGIINCKLEYVYKVTEPELNVYDGYTDKITGDDDNNYFINDEYIGRLTYYEIILKKQLSSDCVDNYCNLCLKESNEYCITCKNNYILSKDDNNNQFYKTCIHDEKEEITEELTDKTTEMIIEKLTDINSEKIIENFSGII